MEHSIMIIWGEKTFSCKLSKYLRINFSFDPDLNNRQQSSETENVIFSSRVTSTPQYRRYTEKGNTLCTIDIIILQQFKQPQRGHGAGVLAHQHLP